MRRLHVIPEESPFNGVCRVAHLLAQEDGGEVIEAASLALGNIMPYETIVVHGMWLPAEWRACRMVLKAGKRLVRMTHGSLSPVYLRRQGRWRKWLVGPIERYYLRRSTRILATCADEERWIRAYEPLAAVELVDLKRFFDFKPASVCPGKPLRVLYLGRCHPLKGVRELEKAVKSLNGRVALRIEDSLVGEEKERALDWCDFLCLPSLSENFGLVVADALEHGKMVVATDGAPVWKGQAGVVFLDGYRDATSQRRVELLKGAFEVWA